MKELENLLNSIIDRGWEPWGIEWDDIELLSLDMNSKNIYIWFMDYSILGEWSYNQKIKAFRELVSLESWLWQFVCKNKLLSDKVDMQDYIEDSYWFRRCPFDTNWVFRIIQSSIHSEEHLAKFLVDNIKLWN